MANSAPNYNIYLASSFGDDEVELQRLFRVQLDDARNYFLRIIKPRLDRSYKLYIAYGGDRQKEIKKWQANVFVPYIQAVVETLMPRILDARPDFAVMGRSENDQAKTEKQQQLLDYLWEIAGMDKTCEDFVRACLIYGTAFLQVSWKKDVRKLKFLDTKDVGSKKYKWREREETFYDAPFCEWVDNYNLWYDWHNTDRKMKHYWFKRHVLTADAIKRRYPMADTKRLALALSSPGGDLVDYAAIRQTTRTAHTQVVKGAEFSGISGISTSYGTDKYYATQDNTLKMYEVFEWIRPFDDKYAVMVGGSYVPIFKDGCMPIIFDFKEAPFIECAYLKIPGEFEGYGVPLILENPQVMLNLIKNQRLDATTLSIHKMWVVNPLANINKDELVTRPFGIIYSIDPNGVREIQFSDIKTSAYKEEDTLKSDMRYASGVDDFSMGAGQDAGSATEIRHLRESTLERVRLFVNHLGESYSDVARYWMDMQRQLFTKTMTIRIIGDDGEEMFPLIEKDDLQGKFDYKATVIPSIAGQQDVKKKQDMDLFQLLIQLPFIDPRKLTSKLVGDFGWSMDSIASADGGQGQPQIGPDGQPLPPGQGMPMDSSQMMGGGMPMDPSQMMGGMPQQPPQGPMIQGKTISPDIARQAIAMLRAQGEPGSAFSQMARPVNMLQSGPPPTARDTTKRRPVGGTTNPRGMNRKIGSRPNTNIATNKKTSIESNLLNRVYNPQR